MAGTAIPHEHVLHTAATSLFLGVFCGLYSGFRHHAPKEHASASLVHY